MVWPKISELAEAERPREKLMQAGVASLSDAELIGIILGSGCADTSAVELGRQLLSRVDGQLGRLGRQEVQELRRAKGIGAAKACSLRAVFELARRLARELPVEQPLLSEPATVARLVLSRIEAPEQEEFHIVLLDTRNRFLRSEMITRGTIDRSTVHPREVFRRAVRHDCARIIVAHNHPSGDPSPSPQDLKVTEGLISAGQIMGIEVLDHVIVGSAAHGPLRYCSLREEGRVVF
ncbi:MAG: hypothetical protein RL095_3742 [Verrucomicrobiota bacterium]|jgi:DNA repair protein RadC